MQRRSSWPDPHLTYMPSEEEVAVWEGLPIPAPQTRERTQAVATRTLAAEGATRAGIRTPAAAATRAGIPTRAADAETLVGIRMLAGAEATAAGIRTLAGETETGVAIRTPAAEMETQGAIPTRAADAETAAVTGAAATRAGATAIRTAAISLAKVEETQARIPGAGEAAAVTPETSTASGITVRWSPRGTCPRTWASTTTR